MAINFSFQGWVSAADIKIATDVAGNTVDVSKMPEQELADNLNNGLLFISLGDYLYDNHEDAEIEIFDFDPPL